jgi:putative ABC transport system permease protein
MSLNMLLNALSQGLLWGVMAIGVSITFRILNYADLTAEGSFTLGAAVAARLIMMGVDPLTSTLVSVVAGMSAGVVTGFLHTVLRIPPLLSGILAMTGLYSINLRIMGTPNIPLLRGTETLITRTADLPPVNAIITHLGITERLGATIVLGLVVLAIVIMLLKMFFNTELGYVVRATGDNEAMAKAQGVNTRRMKVLGLLISNGCIALSGALVFQFQGFADISMGIGVIVVALASVIIGAVIFNNKNNYLIFVAVVLGSIMYRFLIALVLMLGINPHDFRLFSALILATALSVPLIRERFNFDLKKLFLGRR